MLLPIFIVADLIAIYSVVDVDTTLLFVTISLYCNVADVVAIICGTWNTTNCLYVMMADVIAMVVDGITTQGGFLFGRCYGHGGRWNCHWSPLFQF